MCDNFVLFYQEIEQLKEVCEICNGKYLSVYRQQHMNAHKAHNLVIQSKLKVEQKPVIECDISGQRRAAQKFVHN